MSRFSIACEQAARAGGRVLLQYRGKFSVREKGKADLVTEADLASQDAIKSYLYQEFPDHGFLGEEDSDSAGNTPTREFTWVVDPLDGTTNYVHGLENYCVSVALQQGQQIIEGAIYDPIRDVCFRATRHQGAFRNEQPISVSPVEQLSESLVAASFPAHVDRGSPEIDRFAEIVYRCQAIRRLGSAALNLASLAAGRIDAFWSTSLKPWDVAAGALLVEEAGGAVMDLNGSKIDIMVPSLLTASTDTIAQVLLDVLS